MAAKFKVGDRVRRTTGYDSDYGEHRRAGYEFVVTALRVECVEDENGKFHRRENLELVAPTFKVGDRVRATADAAEGEIGTIAKDDGISPRYLVKFDKWTDGHGNDGCEWWLDTDELESAPLTIVAGRYYKTRDGRKVGPMCLHSKTGYIETIGDGRIWAPDGKFVGIDGRGKDIIAEWPTETAKRGNPAATVDAIADEYGGAKSGGPKFKVGDRVRVVKTGYILDANQRTGSIVESSHTARREDYWRVDLDNYGGALGFFTSEIELIHVAPAIVALIENGQPKPATEPFVHPDRAAASKEAARLAGKHKGKEFGVYEFVSSVSVTPDHEWQRLAAGGKTWAAARALSEASGLPYDMAKSSVEYWLMRAA